MDTPASQEPRRAHMTFRVLGGAAGMVLAVGLHVLYVQNQTVRDVVRPVRAAFVNATVPAELMHAHLVEYGDGTTRYIDARSGAVLETVPGTIISEDTRGAARARVVHNQDGSYAVSSTEGVVYATSTAPLVGVALSPSGTFVAFARATRSGASLPTVAFLPSLQSSPDDWEVVVVHSSTRERVLSVRGALPFFLDDGTVGYVDSTGVKSMSLDRKIEHVLVAKRLPRVQLLPLVSPDHMTVAIQDRSASYTHVYSIESETRTLGVVSAFKTPRGVATYLLGSSGLYGVDIVDSKPEVWSRSFDSSMRRTVLIAAPTVQSGRLTLGTF